jgi:hypothetical protein
MGGASDASDAIGHGRSVLSFSIKLRKPVLVYGEELQVGTWLREFDKGGR